MPWYALKPTPSSGEFWADQEGLVEAYIFGISRGPSVHGKIGAMEWGSQSNLSANNLGKFSGEIRVKCLSS